jgi:hypothetical protein
MFIGPAMFVGQSTTDGRHLIARLMCGSRSASTALHHGAAWRRGRMDQFATALIGSCKKGMSALQLSRILGITYKCAADRSV